MKHNKLSISIVSAFIAALGLTACSNATTDENALVTIKGYDGNLISINRDDIYGKLVDSEDGVTSFYNAILEVLIRNNYEKDSSKATKLKSFKQTAHDKVAADHKKAKSDSKTNNTSYDDEWQAILDANGVKDEEGLYQKHLYSLEKEDFADTYFDNAKASLTSEYIGFNDDKTDVNTESNTSVYPYHVRHILVSTEGSSATDYTGGLITESQAKNLNTVYQMLVKGDNTFGEVAYQRSDDKGSKVKYGDSGIMSTKTSFVNEFKLGLYAYDMIYAKDITGDKNAKDENRNAYKKLGLSAKYDGEKTVGDAMAEIGLQKVGYNVFEYLGEVADVTTDEEGNKVNEGVEKYFPRNVVWNNCLNLHNPFIITDTKNAELPTGTTPKLVDDKTKTGFRKITGLSEGEERILTDEDGRVIIGVRSEFGIHFMVMERTPFEIEHGIKSYNSTSTTANYNFDTTTINEYYTTSIPEKDSTKDTYVSHLNGSKTDYAARATEVKNEIKGFDTMYDYRLFESLRADNTIAINDDKVAAEISKLIENKRANIAWTTEKDMNTAWFSYLDKLNRQNEERSDDKRLLKLVCATDFTKASTSGEFTTKEGACYYEA